MPGIHEFLQQLKQPEYVHVLLNPIPVYAMVCGILALVVALPLLTAFADFLSVLAQARTQARAAGRLVFSMTPLVRFPWTPLEFADAYPAQHYQGILERTAGLVRAAGCESWARRARGEA